MRTRPFAAVIAAVALASSALVLTAPSGASPRTPHTVVGSISFANQVVGTTSAQKSAVIPLSTTIGAHRALITDYLTNDVTYYPFTYNSVTILTAAQVKSAILGALAELPDSTVVAIKVTGIYLANHLDFSISGNCDGADGQTTPSCTESATFHPQHGGVRKVGVTAIINTTQGYSAIQSAVGDQIGALFGVNGTLVNILLGLYGTSIHSFVDDSFANFLNPIVDLTGTGLVTVGFNSPFDRVSEGNAGPHQVLVPVQLNAASDSAVKVHYATTSGSATTADHDFVATSGTVTIAAGQTSATIPVMVIGDQTVEGNEGFRLTLSSPPSGVAVLSSTPGVVVVLLNDDKPSVTVVGSSVPEGAPAYVAFTLDAPYTSDLTVHLWLSTGTAHANDFGTLSSASVTFPAETTGPIFLTIPTHLDGLVEPDETFSLHGIGARSPVTEILTIRANST